MNSKPPFPPTLTSAPDLGFKLESKPLLQPALLVDGKTLTGGKTHAAIAQAHATKIIQALLDDANHVFVDEAGKIYNRVQAGQLLGLPGPLESHMLESKGGSR